jgi:hypothetical protein
MEYVVVFVLLAMLALFALAPVLFRHVRGSDPRLRRYAAASREEPPAEKAERFDFSEFPCGHDWVRGEVTVIVRGLEVGLTDKIPVCPDCFRSWLEKYATGCASCDNPILPGMPVGQGWVGAKHPYTHLTMGCCDSGGLYCGMWGQGRLITLHELDPEKFPKGSSNAMDAVMKSGKPVFQKFD